MKDYCHDDWKKVGLDFLAIYDTIKLSDESGKVYSEPTNILGSKFTMWLPLDSDIGVPHLHIAALRIDMDGMTNNDHQILQRAQHAEEILAQRLKWQTAREVRENHKQDLEHNCREILVSMPIFSYDAYFNALRGLKEGYMVETKRDSEERYVSYVVCDGCKRYPASAIGKSRRFTVAHLLPAKVMEFYNEEFNHTAVRNWDDLTRLAVGVFVGAVLGPSEQPSIGTGGGGPSSDLPWRDKDEDDLLWARRCAQYATSKLGKTMKHGR